MYIWILEVYSVSEHLIYIKNFLTDRKVCNLVLFSQSLRGSLKVQVTNMQILWINEFHRKIVSSGTLWRSKPCEFCRLFESL